MPLEGSLTELSLTNIIQVNCNEMSTATVRLAHEGKEGVICFSEGAIVHATVGDLVGEEAVYELLSWPDGTFVVEQDQAAPQRTIDSSWNSLLLEGIRRVDESGLPPMERLDVQPLELEPAGPPAWDEDDDLSRLARELRTLNGVEGSVIISHDGVVFASDIEGNPEKEGSVAVFVGNAATEVGRAMDLTPFDWGLVTMGKDRMLVLEQPTFFIGLLLSEKASPALVSAEVTKVIK
jgi:predicted regulator of Ras-like GTPase activity (Roadblock/LC7/MglB family)